MIIEGITIEQHNWTVNNIGPTFEWRNGANFGVRRYFYNGQEIFVNSEKEFVRWIRLRAFL